MGIISSRMPTEQDWSRKRGPNSPTNRRTKIWPIVEESSMPREPKNPRSRAAERAAKGVVAVNVELPVELVAMADAVAEKRGERTPGFSRSMALREMILEGGKKILGIRTKQASLVLAGYYNYNMRGHAARNFAGR